MGRIYFEVILLDNIFGKKKKIMLSGKEFSRDEIQLIKDIVSPLNNLSRQELANTICENFSWKSPKGDLKVDSCLKAFIKLESLGFLSLPAAKKCKARTVKKICWGEATDEKGLLSNKLGEIGEITLVIPEGKIRVDLWNEYVDRYHYLRHKKPFGSSIRYFIMASNQPSPLGCLLFSPATWSGKPRDTWIGWEKSDREKNLRFIVNNSRFLIFPWVKVENLASKVLSIASKQIREDWQQEHGYMPALIETFVDSSLNSGICYKAANWHYLGKTSGRGRSDQGNSKTLTPKHIFVFPLISQFRKQLVSPEKKKRASKKPIAQPTRDEEVEKKFVSLWSSLGSIVVAIANDHDAKWIQRRRVLTTMILVLLIYRLIFSKGKSGYQIILDSFWDSCEEAKIAVPQKRPISAAAFSYGRKKLNESVFVEINKKIILEYEQYLSVEQRTWKGHNIYAVDGSKINLPLALRSDGYLVPSPSANYPQGLLSTLYQLKTKIPTDFSLTKHGDERKSALAHLNSVSRNGIVVYDRGYFSFEMLYTHINMGIHPIFRMKSKALSVIDEFGLGNNSEEIITVFPSPRTRKELKNKIPLIEIKPIKIRLLKYTIKETTYCLATTLLDSSKYPETDFPDLYHARWGVEELYKISKNIVDVEDFHAKHERGVKQELYAHFNLITLNRIVANKVEDGFMENTLKPDRIENKAIKINFKKCMSSISKNMEKLFLAAKVCAEKTIRQIANSIELSKYRKRDGRSFPRKSMKPSGKWRPPKYQNPKSNWPTPIEMST